MYRKLIEELFNWKQSKNRKPLILRGARQVGKTWLMKEFGKSHYDNIAYISFDNNQRMKGLFSEDFDIERLIDGLSIEARQRITPECTLIILDEIQECPKALTSLKYFYENHPEYHIIAAGSLLGVAMHEGTNFPVGKISYLDLFPLSFMEFLMALGKDDLLRLMENKDYELITVFSNQYTNLLRQYYYVGGMPEAVLSFSQTRDYEAVRAIQREILMTYQNDFSKHVPRNTVARVQMLWNSILSQLAKENRKFIYGLIREGARAKEYELAMSWLCDSGLIYKVGRINKPSLPIKAYEDLNAFKLYLVDVGLLGAMGELDQSTLIEGNAIFEEFKGALTEQYVFQQLKTVSHMPICYWSSDSRKAEVDFVVQTKGQVIPIEVKAEENLHAKSLKYYIEKYKPQVAFRASMSSYRKESTFTNIPLYMICLEC